METKPLRVLSLFDGISCARVALGDRPTSWYGASEIDINAIAVSSIRCVKSVIEVANKKSRGGHPTAKPIELYKWLIERYSKEGDTILDPTAGSFNSCFTAIEMKRRAIGIEMNGSYFWSATNRLIQ